jgi:allantoin racemase
VLDYEGDSSMRIVIMNCNTNSAMTRAIGEVARSAAADGTEILAVQPNWGPQSVEGFYESHLSAAAVLQTLTELDERFDALVMAGFGEHGREGARQILSVPVVDITEAAAIMALLIGRRYGVVTTVEPAVGPIEDSLSTAGLDRRLVGIGAAGIPVAATYQDVNSTVESLIDPARRLIGRGADVIALGCAGFGGLASRLSRAVDVPVVDGVTSAIGLAEAMVRAKLTTAKSGAYAPILSQPAKGNW